MPLNLDSTAPLRGEKPRRRWTLIIMGHGRWGYLRQCFKSLTSFERPAFDRIICACDGCEMPDWPVYVEPTTGYVNFAKRLTTGPERKGLTANLTQAWGALTDEDEWVFHVEEDFVIHDAPLDAMADVMDANPRVANMVLARQPWNAEERRAGSVLATIPGLIDRGGWCQHRAGFWLNPMVARASLLRSLEPGVESLLSGQCRERGLSFGYWGGPNDPPRCEHIGFEGGMGSEGWRP